MLSYPLDSRLGSFDAAVKVLESWRSGGLPSARNCIELMHSEQPGLSEDRLQRELLLRIYQCPGPRILVDGVWFTRPYGGVTRVWEQILNAWKLPGLVTSVSPICLIERGSRLAASDSYQCLDGASADPIAYDQYANLDSENSRLAHDWSADVFVSSWITTASSRPSSCSQVALVHDCLPERANVCGDHAFLRRAWLQEAQAHLAVSLDTALDVDSLLGSPIRSTYWCHPAPHLRSHHDVPEVQCNSYWQRLCSDLNIIEPYVLLPATSAIGSYKNPEQVALALEAPSLRHVQLVLSGLSAEQRCAELKAAFPYLRSRCISAGFSDEGLRLAYRHALAVVVPSHAEGFGLPVVEAMASGGTVLIADSRGLREAGGAAALRFQSRSPTSLSSLIELLLSEQSIWLKRVLQRRAKVRLSRLHSHLLGLSILALARESMTKNNPVTVR
jgi:glycosyltransferase involved in cell wall biosynthesis